jgi:hypothetical protein
MEKFKQRTQEEEEIRQRVNMSSFAKRIAHASKLLISSFVGSSNDELRCISTYIRRFERPADGADEFLKLIEFGRTP